MNLYNFWKGAKTSIFIALSLIVSLLVAIFLLPFFLIIIAIFFLILWKSKREMEKRKKPPRSTSEDDIIEIFPIDVKPYTSTKDEELAHLIEVHQREAKTKIINENSDEKDNYR